MSNVSTWLFPDSSDLAVISQKSIIAGRRIITYVTHDLDGGWQFLDKHESSEQEVSVIGLGEIFEIDASVSELADLPLGWHAWRETKTSGWVRGKMTAE